MTLEKVIEISLLYDTYRAAVKDMHASKEFKETCQKNLDESIYRYNKSIETVSFLLKRIECIEYINA